MNIKIIFVVSILISFSYSFKVNPLFQPRSSSLFFSILDAVIVPSVESTKQQIKDILSVKSPIDYSKRKKLNALANDLESTVNMGAIMFPRLWSQLSGDWELKYSNVFSKSTTHESLTGIKRVIQRIEHQPALRVDHILELDNRKDNLININALIRPLRPISNIDQIKAIKLVHDAEVTSESEPAQLRIFLDHIDVLYEAREIEQIQSIRPILPWSLFPLKLNPFRSSSYDTTYIDDEIRISRGIAGELRIFYKI